MAASVAEVFVPQCGLEQGVTAISVGELFAGIKMRALSLMKMEKAPPFSISVGCWPER